MDTSQELKYFISCLPDNISCSLYEILELKKGWYEGGPGGIFSTKGEETISRDAISAAVLVLLLAYIKNHLPNYVVPSPANSVDLVFDTYTLCIIGHDKMFLLDHISSKCPQIGFKDLIEKGII